MYTKAASNSLWSHDDMIFATVTTIINTITLTHCNSFELSCLLGKAICAPQTGVDHSAAETMMASQVADELKQHLGSPVNPSVA